MLENSNKTTSQTQYSFYSSNMFRSRKSTIFTGQIGSRLFDVIKPKSTYTKISWDLLNWSTQFAQRIIYRNPSNYSIAKLGEKYIRPLIFRKALAWGPADAEDGGPIATLGGEPVPGLDDQDRLIDEVSVPGLFRNAQAIELFEEPDDPKTGYKSGDLHGLAGGASWVDTSVDSSWVEDETY